jgi:hypothetical protein
MLTLTLSALPVARLDRAQTQRPALLRLWPGPPLFRTISAAAHTRSSRPEHPVHRCFIKGTFKVATVEALRSTGDGSMERTRLSVRAQQAELAAEAIQDGPLTQQELLYGA